METAPRNLSATCIAAFKACPMRYRLAYIEGLRVEDTPALRIGNAWHKGLEALQACNDVGSPISEGEACGRAYYAIKEIEKIYETRPDHIELNDWLVEREIVVNSLAGYAWLYGDDTLETVATELKFDLPLTNPETGGVTHKFRRVGKVDRLIRFEKQFICNQEYKSTSKQIDSDSSYWDRLRLDTQNKFYIRAVRDLQNQGYGAPSPIVTDTLCSGVLHDVWHKPQISPKMLTQADSKAFMETGEYCGQKFEVATYFGKHVNDTVAIPPDCRVDGVVAQVEPGKKEGSFALRETPGMFGARLLQDITTRPEFYFARRMIAYTDQDLREFDAEIWAIQRTITEMINSGNWFRNEFSCEATFKCPYCPICYHNLQVCDGETTPGGFHRIYKEDLETPVTE